MIRLAALLLLLLGSPALAAQAGYSITTGTHTSCAGSVRVPGAVLPGSATQAGASGWCGIGDYSGADLMQLGVKVCVQKTGGALCVFQPAYAWYEAYPAGEVQLSQSTYPTFPGDTINFSLSCSLPCVANTSQTWNISISNPARGWTFTTSIAGNSSIADNNWITEAPFVSGPTQQPTADFGKMLWAGAMDNGSPAVLSGPFGYTGCCGQNVSTSAPDATHNGFATCFGFASVTTCPAPVNGLAFDGGRPTLGKF